MPLITHIKAHAFHNLNAAIRLANENPSAKNTALLQKLTGVRNSHNEIPQKIGDAILKQQRVLLIGKTIRPDIASRKLDKAVFNGYGEIVELPAILKKRDFKVLLKNITKPLKEQPVKNNDERIRTVAECTIDMACVIKNSNIPNNIKSDMETKLKNIFYLEDYPFKP